MSYDKDFFNQYSDYLKENSVRISHNSAFRLLADYHSVLDLGCGLGEFLNYKYFNEYIGMDIENRGLPSQYFIQGDYTISKFDNLPFEPTLVVSLFSIEACYSYKDCNHFYEKIFALLPKVNRIMSSGFFYLSKSKDETVGETGGITSFQTISDPEFYNNSIYSESRYITETPSKMFGPDVVEVFRYLERR
jgi:SAM-dependent methyltransferase